MTNDNTPPDADQRRLMEKFDAALAMVVDTFLEAGLHTAYMREPLRRQLEWAEEATRTSDKQ
jgi:hypothetical protein